MWITQKISSDSNYKLVTLQLPQTTGRVNSITIRATNDNVAGELTKLYLIHTPEKYKDFNSPPKAEYVILEIDALPLTNSDSEASLASPIDRPPLFMKGLGLVVYGNNIALDLVISIELEF